MKKEKAAEFFSNVLNPLLISSVAFVVLIWFDQRLTWIRQFILSAAAVTVISVIPILYLLRLKRKGEIEDMEIMERERRHFPFFLGFINFSAGFVLMRALNAPVLISALMFCHASNTFILLLVTLRWKISAHTTGITGPVTALTFGFGSIAFPLFLLVPVVAVSRVILRRHTVMQVLAGIFLGGISTAVQLYTIFGIRLAVLA